MQTATLWHNPRCSKSRAALELLHQHGLRPEIRDYLQQPPNPDELRGLLGKLALPARTLLRDNEPEYARAGLDDENLDDAALIEAMAAHPALIQRPVLVVGERAVIGRPAEAMLRLLAPGNATDD